MVLENKRRRFYGTEPKCQSVEGSGTEYESYKSQPTNLVMFPYNRALGNVTLSNISKLQKKVITNDLRKFSHIEVSNPFERNITSIAWNPNYPHILVAGSKGGDLLLHNLKSFNDYFSPGIGIGGAVFGLKFCNISPSTVYTACMTGNICKEDLEKKRLSVFLTVPAIFSNCWFTCLDVCYNHNLVLSGNNHGHSCLLETSGVIVWKFKNMHRGTVTHCEFNKMDPNIFVTSSEDQSVKLWDIRFISQRSEPQPLKEFTFERGINSACFNRNGQSLLTTDQQCQLRVYSTSCWTESLVITQPCRYLVTPKMPIKAVWHPMEDIIVVAHIPDVNVQRSDDYTIDFFDGSTGKFKYEIPTDTLDVATLVEFNGTGQSILTAAGQEMVILV